MGRARFRIQRNVEIQKRAASGESLETIAAAFGMTPQSVYGIASRRMTSRRRARLAGDFDAGTVTTVQAAPRFVRDDVNALGSAMSVIDVAVPNVTSEAESVVDARAEIVVSDETTVVVDTVQKTLNGEPTRTRNVCVVESSRRRKKHPRRAVAQRNIEIQERADKGESAKALAAAYGLAYQTVYMVLNRRIGVKRAQPKGGIDPFAKLDR